MPDERGRKDARNERAEPRRADGGFGDDQGTRIGRPDPGQPRDSAAPSTRAVSEGLEGSILDGESSHRGEPDSDREPMRHGSGSEANGGADAAGGRTREHQSGYGGEGSEPKTSSDQREPLDPT